MRLIDADELISILEWNKGREKDKLVSINNLIKFLKSRPADYDVDKVIKQLKTEEKLAEEKKRCSCGSTIQWEEAKGYANGISVAIDIVKDGGMDGLD
ncbi:hypothetical protein H8S00_04970 [Eubacterium sp. BX4]|uniref:Uncharacterized protein n=1 Tax=Eubacterium segne TaxID=2763045 RepID=A0ABR7F138_9FIRM|nr:hypothetical protein [Eubacterium segne]MBC5667337.1 hypothetical protein [Eubacterium segne]